MIIKLKEKLSTGNELKLNEQEKRISKFSYVFFVIIVFLMFLYASIHDITYWEIDSYALPVISIQNRGSFIMQESDLERARTDFPNLYAGVYSYDDLRSSKLVKITDSEWLSYYFPAYSLVCIPFKVLLNVMNLNQERCFPLTNVLLLSIALYVVLKKMNAPIKIRLVTMSLLGISMAYFLLPYASGEVYIYSFTIIALVCWYNRNFYGAALFISIASLPQPTIMAVGIVILLDFLFDLWKKRKEINIKKAFAELMRIGLSFVISLIPFIFNYVCAGALNYTASMATSENLWKRFLAYIFDLNLGFFGWYPILVVALLGVSIAALVCRNWKLIKFLSAFYLTVFMYSCARHINCGMKYISRYNIWSYAILVFCIILGFEVYEKLILIVACLSIISTCIISKVNVSDEGYLVMNHTSQFILTYVPQLYNPYYYTFISRVTHVDGGYTYQEPVIYYDSQGYARKILLKGTEDDKEQVINSLKGSNEDMNVLQRLIDEVPNDEKYHYINLGKYMGVDLKEKNIEEMGIVSEDNVMVDEKSDILLSSNENTIVYALPISLEDNTTYKIEIMFDEESLSESGDTSLHVDFYSPDGYDDFAHEVILNLNEIDDSNQIYTCFIDSGSVPENCRESCYVRIFGTSEKNIILKSVRVVKMTTVEYSFVDEMEDTYGMSIGVYENSELATEQLNMFVDANRYVLSYSAVADVDIVNSCLDSEYAVLYVQRG